MATLTDHNLDFNTACPNPGAVVDDKGIHVVCQLNNLDAQIVDFTQ